VLTVKPKQVLIMLINTVILLLRNALPIAIIIALLLLTTSSLLSKAKLSKTTLLKSKNAIFSDKKIMLIGWSSALFLSVLITFTLVYNLAEVAQLYQGRAIELLFSCGFLAIYLVILSHLYSTFVLLNNKLTIKTAMSVFILVFSINATNFFIYFTGFWSQTELQSALFVGMILGMGICISIGILLYFMLLLIMPKYQQNSIFLLLFLFGCGQLNQAINLLLQIDLLPSFESLWDSNFLLNEESELGHFFTALLGYEATPSALHLAVYLVAIFIPLIWLFFQRKELVVTVKQEQNNEYI
jgi:high-affinity iron transporter